jgi:uncharacterized protein (TIGR03435 family)
MNAFGFLPVSLVVGMKFAILAILCIYSLSAQEFEVASVRPSAPPTSSRIRVDFEGGPGTGDPTRFSCRNCSQSLLVMHAYDVEYDQIAGLNSRTELYDIEAKVPEGTTKDQFRVMLQKLLSRRFNMRLHRETRQMQAYELVAGKDGPKIKESLAGQGFQEATDSNASRNALDDEGFPILPKGQSGYASVNGRARMQVLNTTMDQLARKLSNQLDTPVINATGLAGRYDCGLYWAGRSVDGTDDGNPSLFFAVESQLGLRLQPKKAAVPIVVIDHADRAPTEN